MAISATALSAALSATGLTMNVSSGSGFPTAGGTTPQSGYLVRIDKEFMLAILQPVTGIIKLAQRGYAGTAAAAHDTLAKVEVSNVAGDFADPAPGSVAVLPSYIPSMVTLGQDTTFTSAQIAAYGNQPQNFAITKATAIAITLVAPSKAQDGLTMTFTSLTDAIHVITATSLFASGGAASPYTTATWANAKAGGAITVQAENALWNVVNSLNVNLT